MLRFVTFAIASFAIWLSGAWWENGDRKAASAALLFATFILAVGALSGCASREGDGFSNSGAYQGRQCVEKTRYGERWFNCEK
jgi:hypothetical protein